MNKKQNRHMARERLVKVVHGVAYRRVYIGDENEFSKRKFKNQLRLRQQEASLGKFTRQRQSICC
jgi:hypothetical protein